MAFFLLFCKFFYSFLKKIMKASDVLSKNKPAKWLKIAVLYLSIVGIISGSCFIIEEAIQTAIFANFSATDTHRYDLVLKNINQIETINKRLRLINSILMVIQPIAWFGYESFCSSTDLYVETLEAEIMAFEPDLLIGRDVSIRFKYTRLKSINKDLVWAVGPKIKVMIRRDQIPQNRVIEMTGRVTTQSIDIIDKSPRETFLRANKQEDLKELHIPNKIWITNY